MRAHAREIAEGHLEKGDDYGWFEALYAEAAGDAEHIPWGDLVPNRFLVEWEEGSPLSGEGKNAMVVACGLGDDADFLADRGFTVTAFDVSETAIEWAKKLYPSEKIEFEQADLFDLPAEWTGDFDLVLDVYTVQALPPHLREKAIKSICGLVKSGGELIAVTRLRDEGEILEGPPWPLSDSDVRSIEAFGFYLKDRKEFAGDEDIPQTRAVFRWKKSG